MFKKYIMEFWDFFQKSFARVFQSLRIMDLEKTKSLVGAKLKVPAKLFSFFLIYYSLENVENEAYFSERHPQTLLRNQSFHYLKLLQN